MKRKLFGENRGRGVSGVSLLSYGIDVRKTRADPVTVITILPAKQRKRKVTLRKSILPE